MGSGAPFVNQPGSARSGGSSDDNVEASVGRLLGQSPEQQAATIRKQAGKLSQLQSLLDVAIQEQNLENSNDTARIGQLMEVLAIKDEANRDLHRGVQELEAALAEARMNLEYLHSKWRDEAVAREEADTTIKLLRSQIDASQAEAERHVRLCAAAQEQAYIATEDAAVRLEAQQETERQLAALAREFTAHAAASTETKHRFAALTARKGHLALLAGCFTEWRCRLEVGAMKAKLVKALDTGFKSRRLVMWKAARGLEACALMDDFEMRARAEVDGVKEDAEERLVLAEAAREDLARELRAAEQGLRSCQEELIDALERNQDLSLRVENSPDSGAHGPASGTVREAQLEADLRRARHDARVLEEELRLAQDLSSAVRARGTVPPKDAVGDHRRSQALQMEAARARMYEEELLDAGAALGLTDVPPATLLATILEIGRKGRVSTGRLASFEQRCESLVVQVSDLSTQLRISQEEKELLRSLSLSLTSDPR
eukprot:CAMPEP_0180224544 /NCGR_PEP_ID=MMETSP0987-20121128/22145_1 /TAXON_ID=697907 /ORGANISM="non described non described, Strain CCMP2293" /LENGTH=488 /DNA_ID=CAMNT_0022187395 /DNA_START=10 /DNA_END=1476 /DNA_ORIENTATION=+